MSVNIFGGGIHVPTKSRSTSVDVTDVTDVKEKLNALEVILQSKLSQFGDQTISGDLFLSLRGVEERKFGVNDISENESVTLLLGNDTNKIFHRFFEPIEIESDSGVILSSGGGNVCTLGDRFNRIIRFYGPLVMNDNLIHNLKDPLDHQDAVTKRYVDHRYVKCSVGYIPFVLNVNTLGFVASASSANSFAIKAFQLNNTNEWALPSGSNQNFWIQIELPEPILVHKFALRSKLSDGDTILNWNFEGSSDGLNFTELYVAVDKPLSSVIQYFLIDLKKFNLFNLASVGYKYYRLFVKDSRGLKPGLSYFQIYSLDSIVNV